MSDPLTVAFSLGLAALIVAAFRKSKKTPVSGVLAHGKKGELLLRLTPAQRKAKRKRKPRKKRR